MQTKQIETKTIGEMFAQILPPTPELMRPLPIFATRVPDAVVLLMVEYTCKRCETVWRAPNAKLMFRYGNILTRAEDRPFVLPRETREIKVAAPACEHCWEERG